ncbi:surface-adhesin E family protein [Noviherbaspirillum galbum]|uniref:Surface-adhesin protein E-like domain-containing protein n=1 Tax=Noviherbaspirillum galbum TaxID=2709383 RepID=A0A6B3SI59_9BURK|nr:surface-adhesin E family protein [Noviherbaspirillum galbum]NEX60318.1 hypothetical protein [Noviherbaspirillum galbum]
MKAKQFIVSIAMGASTLACAADPAYLTEGPDEASRLQSVLDQAPESAASLYRQGEFSMGPSWRGLRALQDAAVFLHRSVRRGENGTMLAWTDRELLRSAYLEKERPYLSLREHVSIDCAGMRVGVLESVYYEQRFGGGEPLARIRQKPEMIDILPDSLEDQMQRIACESKPSAKPAGKSASKSASPKADKTDTTKEPKEPKESKAPQERKDAAAAPRPPQT